MDDNNKQKSTDNSASARPGIFSTPDLTIDAEKIAQPTPSADANKTRVASYFANTDATRQAQQPTIASQPLEGDIVIDNSPKKRSKLPIIILALAVLALVAVIIIFSTIRKTNKNDTYDQLKTAFLEYSNFVLHGEASNKELNDDCVKANNCYFMQILQSKEKFDKFYEDSGKLEKNLKSALETWEKTTTSTNDNDALNDILETGPISKTLLINNIESIISLYEFIPMYIAYSGLTNDDVVEYYLKNGKTATQDYITNHYKTETGNRYFDSLNKDGIDMSEATLKNMELYTQYGCVEDGSMDSTCFYERATEEEKEEANENNRFISDYPTEMLSYYNMIKQFPGRVSEGEDLFNRYESGQNEKQ